MLLLNKGLVIPAIFTILLCTSLPALAEEEEKKTTGWFDDAELSYVKTAGNSDTTTLGLANTLKRVWEPARFIFKVGAIRAENTVVDRFAIGDLGDYDITEISTTDVTAETYYADARYERDISKKFYWYAGLGWDRNTPAGIQNRYVAQAGVGNIWYDRDTLKWKTDYALTYTDQEDVVPIEAVDDTFVGGRITSDFLVALGKSSTFENDTVLDLNFNETSDWRGDMVNSLTVSMSKSLALKVSLRWLYQNEPRFGLIDLYALPDDPDPIGEVPYRLDSLDTIFTTSLVITF